MKASQLPDRAASLDNDGFQKLLTMLSDNKKLAKKVADEIERDPRKAVKRYFRLSILQRTAIDNTPDKILKIKSAQLVAALRNGVFEGITYDPGKEEDISDQSDMLKRYATTRDSCICEIFRREF